MQLLLVEIKSFISYSITKLSGRSQWFDNDKISLCLRVQPKYIGEQKVLCFIIANVSIVNKGEGTFTELFIELELLVKQFPGIEALFIENLMTKRFEQFFYRRHFVKVEFSNPTCLIRMKK